VHSILLSIQGEDIYVVPFWNLIDGEEADEGEGELAGLQVKEKKRIYYMASRWPNRNDNNNDAILPLALESYSDGKMYTNNKWDSDNEEGVKQFFYKKKNTGQVRVVRNHLDHQH
jgi:hypothetical protein